MNNNWDDWVPIDQHDLTEIERSFVDTGDGQPYIATYYYERKHSPTVVPSTSPTTRAHLM